MAENKREQLRQQLKELYKLKKQNPKDKKIKVEYERVLDEFDKEGQKEDFPF
jgi:hypothetical protein